MRGNNVEFQITEFLSRRIGQTPDMGVLPTLFAATAPGLPGDSYIGPKDLKQSRGYPTIVDRSAAAQNMAAAGRLWEVSTDLTGVEYPI